MLPRRTALLLLALPIMVLQGCITIAHTETEQLSSLGPVKLTVSTCTDSSPNCSGVSNASPLYSQMGDTTINVQPLFAVRLPAGSTPPQSIPGKYGAGATFTLQRATDYETQLQALEPAAEGERWWGWRSQQTIPYSQKSAQGFTVEFVATLPRPQDGGPLPSPMRWRPVVGGRYVGKDLPADRAVACGTDKDDLYGGYHELGGAGSTIVYADSPSPEATRGYLEAPIVDFGLTGTTVQASPGSTVSATFLARRTGVADPATTFALAVSGGPPGAEVKLDRASVPLSGDATVPVLATVTVPAGTLPGDHALTLTATAPGKPARTGTAIVRVPSAAGPQPTATPTPAGTATPGGGGADTAAPLIRSLSLKKRFKARAKQKLAIDVSEAATLIVSVEAVKPGRRAGAKCSTRARKGRRCTVARPAGELRRAVAAGPSTVAFDGTTPKLAKPKPGGFRLRVVAVDAAGNRSAPKTLAYTLTRR
jgi:hypothetical protein